MLMALAFTAAWLVGCGPKSGLDNVNLAPPVAWQASSGADGDTRWTSHIPPSLVADLVGPEAAAVCSQALSTGSESCTTRLSDGSNCLALLWLRGDGAFLVLTPGACGSDLVFQGWRLTHSDGTDAFVPAVGREKP